MNHGYTKCSDHLTAGTGNNKMYGPTSGQIYCRPPGQLVFWPSNLRRKWRSHMKPKSMNTLVSAPFKHWASAPSIWEGSEFRVEANVFTKFWNVGSGCLPSYRVTGTSVHLTSFTKSTVHSGQQGLLACNYPQKPKFHHHYCFSLGKSGPQHLKKDYAPMDASLLKAKWTWNSVISVVLFLITDYLGLGLAASNRDMKPLVSCYTGIYCTSTQAICDP